LSFAQKLLTVNFSLANGQFSGGGNSLSLTDMRMSASISAVPGTAGSSLDALDIYGMTLSQMNQLSVIGKQLGTAYQQNKVTVIAQDGNVAPATVFQGIILQAYVMAQDQPHVHFHVNAKPDAAASRKPIPVTTKKGAAQAQTLAQSLASAMGFKFENNSVSTSLRNPYLWGTGISQMRQLSKAASFDWIIDPGTNALAIWPKGKSRTGNATTISPYISGPGELIGYPVFSNSRIYVTAYYDPQMKPQGQINVVSSLTAAQGLWNVRQVNFELESFTPHGRWQMTIAADSPDNSPSSGTQ
jgi:hypothetical protein